MDKIRTVMTSLIIIFSVLMLFHTGVVTARAEGTKVPKVPFQYALGLQKYQKICSSCHGKWGEGSKQGPPLMHPFYKPSHHGDAAFYRAALRGVKAHHWEFGDMPAISGITRKELDKIIPFIRWLQQEKGVYKK